MATYAILGATGRVGGSVMQLLSENPDNKLHLYVRSKQKILSSEPAIARNSNITIFEGDLRDAKVIKSCIANTRAVFLTVALSENLPGCSVAIDTAQVVVQALQELRDAANNNNTTNTQTLTQTRLPRLVVLSSSSVSDKFWTGIPWLVHRLVYDANRNIYEDLKVAEKYLREQEDWLRVTFVKPGILSDDVRRGYKLDTTRFGPAMSFADLAAAMIEIADASGQSWDMQDVSIVPETEGQGARIPFQLPYVLTKGLLANYLPWLYMSLRTWLP